LEKIAKSNIVANRIQLENTPVLDSAGDNVYLARLILVDSVRISNNAGNTLNNTIIYEGSNIGQNGIRFPTFASISAINDNIYVFWQEINISSNNVTNSIAFKSGNPQLINTMRRLIIPLPTFLAAQRDKP
jgi:hypothetical protein